MVKDGRMMQGKPTCSSSLVRLFHAVRDTVAARGVSRPIRLHRADRTAARSSAMSIASQLVAPINSTPLSLSRTPSSSQVQRAVQGGLPPHGGQDGTSGFSTAMIRVDRAATRWARCRSHPPWTGSVMMVAGLEFTRMTRKPSFASEPDRPARPSSRIRRPGRSRSGPRRESGHFQYRFFVA